ncbi:type 1 fimbrial protein [Burkholderia sp. Bp8963]|uniref:fimbrial protein n=1 Tax=Burkholderia sp. Bp8963 TaxID=2184547 RepID=UPI000F5A04EA|nr:fimbrial protein [Burkholderia sp. Bp8963]RQS75669.1 type 1 fimbrial protein [Burkholderia sp. Bp8963]
MKTLFQTTGRRARAALLGLVAGGCTLLCSAHAQTRDATAVDCTFDNVKAGPWLEINSLTNSTATGTVLYERNISLFINYNYGPGAREKHELVSAGHWLPVGSMVANGIAETNVDGIGFQWVGVSDDSEEHTLRQRSRPVAFSKHAILRPGSWTPSDAAMAIYRQRLILQKSASELPAGDLVINDLPGNPTVTLYALDLPVNTASIGGEVDVPAVMDPPGSCKLSRTYRGMGNLTIGGGPIVVPKKCEIEDNWIIPVNLGHVAISQFPTPNAVSPPVEFNIELSQCAAAAKPAISFRDKSGKPNADPTLLQLSGPSGTALASGFNIVMTNVLTGERIAFGEPGAARQYPMQRSGTTAVMPLRAQYIRTGAAGELKPGYAGGAAEFTFTFP